MIETSSAKTLAQPTLLVQEGQEAEVQTGTSVITSVSTTDTSSGSTQFEYQRENAGLNLKVQVSKIDDNGFISLSVNPEISVLSVLVKLMGLIFSIFLVDRSRRSLFDCVTVKLLCLQV